MEQSGFFKVHEIMFFYFNDGESDFIELLMNIYSVDFLEILDRLRRRTLLLLRNLCDGRHLGHGEQNPSVMSKFCHDLRIMRIFITLFGRSLINIKQVLL